MSSTTVIGAIVMLLLGVIFGYMASGRRPRSAESEPAPERIPEPAPERAPEPKPAPAKAKPAASKKKAAPAKARTSAKKKDDLKKISGVGPALEKKLHGLGVTSFQQIAEWKAADIEEVDDKLNFKGRIQRDDWVKQAKILAEGGETEFSRRKK